jgi:hypothetical protein
MSVQDYLNLVIPQHRTKAKFSAWLTVKLGMLQNVNTILGAVAAAYDLDNAVGTQLDILGKILGMSRLLPFQPASGASPTLTDTYYRLVLRAKIMSNQWDGTREGYDEMIATIFAAYPIGVIDYADMSMDVILFLAEADPMISDLLVSGYLFPVPVGIVGSFKAVAEYTWGWYFYKNRTWSDEFDTTWDEMGVI